VSTDAFEKAGELVDPEHRLPGEEESESSPIAADARHWADVYEELMSFKRHLLDTVHEQRDEVSESARHEVESDRTMLESEFERLRRRYSFWIERVRQLEGGA
jgi:hypothetical protein